MKFCPECGSKLVEGAKFCGSCGAKLLKEVESFDIDKFCKSLIITSDEGVCTEKVTSEDVFFKIKDAADRGNGLAAYVVSSMYSYGFDLNDKELLPGDPDERVRYLFIAAKAGCHFAQSELGNALWCGIEDSEDYEEGEHPDSFYWIEKAAKQGNVFALHRASYAYLDGDYGQKVDWTKALDCFKDIIEAKDTEVWKDEWIERATGYLRYFPQIIEGDKTAMQKLGEWLKERESNWDYSFGLGGIEESAFWLKKAKSGEDVDNDDEEEDEDLANEEAQLEAEFDDDDYDEIGEGDDSDDEG
jgi:TPR repeat protein